MTSEVTQLLEQYRQGDAVAFDALAQIIYPELKAMARRRTRSGDALGATTLVNETFVKLLEGGALKPRDRQQFFGLAATIMRRVIVDEVRHAAALKRSGPEVTYSDEQVGDGKQEAGEFLLQVEELLKQLEGEDAQLARVFECRYFAGFTTEETAEALGTSVRSAERLWSSARSRIAELMSETTR